VRKNYYYENNLDRMMAAAEQRVEELKIQMMLRMLNRQLAALAEVKKVYPPHQEEEEASTHDPH
jgi:hypothetical protein